MDLVAILGARPDGVGGGNDDAEGEEGEVEDGEVEGGRGEGESEGVELGEEFGVGHVAGGEGIDEEWGGGGEGD